ncbi:OLC1v1035147C1 [Oldenlandia corymbosa var. corymbosa]|uniref:OLC1v1035147C1 n=1 Tax=Oldenlandia corymbosa var. corymbosa TaxID=529605 RepID=A0AAV1CVD3_OLDCO|nr:OLC1v1035147C1 [Oldenlandia corymbosa var. corymbosa]
MFSSTQMDAAGGFSATQNNDGSLSSAKSRDAQPMLPVTVKQISDAVPSDDKATFVIDGVDVKHVMLVGMAFEKSQRVTDVSFVIDDGTGRINCHRWVNDTVDTSEVDLLSDGSYVRVHGLLKAFQGNKQIEVFAIRPVTNHDEVSCHFLSCIHYHTYISKKNGVTISSQPHSSTPAVSTTMTGVQNSFSDHFSGQQSTNGHKGIDQMVLEYLERPMSQAQEKGVHKNEIASNLKLSMDKISEVIETLESEGLIYSTIDENHYKSTSCG